MATHRNTIWSNVLMIFTAYTHAHRSDLDSKSILSGESSVGELLSVYDPGVAKNLMSITARISS